MINQLKKYKRIAIGAGVAVVFVTIMIIPLLISQIAYMNKSACDQSSSSVIVDSDGSTQKNQEAIWAYFLAQGYSEEATAGIMGNMHTETGGTFDPSIVQGGGSFVLGKTGFGLVQWTSASYQNALFDYADQTGRERTDLNLQLDFLCTQQLPSFSWVKGTTIYFVNTDEFKRSDSIDKTTEAFMLCFERPADQSQTAISNRIKHSQSIYDEFNGKTFSTVIDTEFQEACASAGSSIGGILSAEGVTIDFSLKYYTYSADRSQGNPNVCAVNKPAWWPYGSYCTSESVTGRFNKMICSSYASGRYWQVNYPDDPYPLPTNWDQLLTNEHTAPGNGSYSRDINNPIPKSIVSITNASGNVKHVAFIEGVDTDGSVVISECNVTTANEYGFKCAKYSSLREWMNSTLGSGSTLNGMYGK